MAKKVHVESEEPMGPILEANLVRLGYGQMVVMTTRIAEIVANSTGKPMSRQRISALLNAVRIEPQTIATLAKALGVKPAELTRPLAKAKPKGRG